MATPLYPTFKKRVDDAFEQLIKRQVTPWSFMTAGPPFRIKSFDGKEIAYQNIGFEGSPRDVFWSRYIEPFLEHICISEIEAAVSMARGKGVDAKLLLPELQGLLSAGFKNVYEHMADVDRRLRGKGYPNSVALRSVELEIQRMDKFLDERITAEIDMWRPMKEERELSQMPDIETARRSATSVDIKKITIPELVAFLKCLSLGSWLFIGGVLLGAIYVGYGASELRSKISPNRHEDQEDRIQRLNAELQQSKLEIEQQNNEIASLKKQNSELLKQPSKEVSKAPPVSASKNDSIPTDSQGPSIYSIQAFFRTDKETPQQIIARVRELHGVRPLLDLEDSKRTRELTDHVYGFTTVPIFDDYEFNYLHRFPSKDSNVELHILDKEMFVIGFVTREEAMKAKEAKKIAFFPKPWLRAQDAVLAIPASRIKKVYTRKIQTDKKETVEVLDIILESKPK